MKTDALLPTGIRRKHSDGLEDVLNTGHIPDESCPAHVRSTGLPLATLNLVLAVLGAGQLTMPYALSQLGTTLGLGSLCFFTWLSMHSLKTLSLYEIHFTPTGCLDTYADLVVRVLGVVGSKICNFLLVTYAWGGAVAFMVILKSELGELTHHFVVGCSREESGQGLLLLLALCVLWPLSSLEDLSFMKRFSWMGCAAALFITFVTLLKSEPWPRIEQVIDDDRLLTNEDAVQSMLLDVAAALPLLSFALNSTWAYIPILCTLKERTSQTNALIVLSNAVILGNYLCLSISGYGTFGKATKPNIMENLGQRHPGDPWVLFAKMSLCLQLTLALPLRFFVARKTLLGGAASAKLRVVTALLLVSSATALALPKISLALVLGLTSSVCASMIIYILPATIDLKLQLPGVLRKLCSAVSLLVGLFILVAGVYANLAGVSVAS